MTDEKSKNPAGGQPEQENRKQNDLRGVAATAGTEASETAVFTDNYVFKEQGQEELPDDDPRKGTVADPNLRDRAWVNRKFEFNIKKRR